MAALLPSYLLHTHWVCHLLLFVCFSICPSVHLCVSVFCLLVMLCSSLCKFVLYSLQHSETFDVSHVFLPLTIAELSTLKQVHFFGPLCIYVHNKQINKQSAEKWNFWLLAVAWTAAVWRRSQRSVFFTIQASKNQVLWVSTSTWIFNIFGTHS